MAPYWVTQVDVPAALSVFGFTLVVIPLFWHLRAWNTGCVLYIFWIGGLCLTNGINMLLWRENAINFAPTWCDIYIRFYVASSIGIISSSLVITRRLYHIVNMTTTATDFSPVRKRRNALVDLSIGLGIPLLAVALFWFYQGHRFDIFEGIGCIEAYPNTFLSILLNMTWPVLIGLVSAIYGLLALRGTLDRTKDLKRLQIVEPTLTISRYYRLMVLAAANVLFTIPLAIYMIVINLREGLYPYRGFAELHSRFGRVDSTAAVIWRQDATVVTVMNFRVWTPIPCAMFFFVIFGFTTEARTHYRAAFLWVAGRVGVQRRRASETTSHTVVSHRPCVTCRALNDDNDVAGTGYQKSAVGSHQATPLALEVGDNLERDTTDPPRTSLPPRHTTLLQPPAVHLSSGEKPTLYVLHPTTGLNPMDMA